MCMLHKNFQSELIEMDQIKSNLLIVVILKTTCMAVFRVFSVFCLIDAVVHLNVIF